MSLSTRLKERREQLGLRQADIAEALGITPAAVGNYESGVSTPRAEILFRIFDVLRCDANYLFQDEMKAVPPAQMTSGELEHLENYRLLDQIGREHIELVMKWELDRVTQQQRDASVLAETRQRLARYYSSISSDTSQLPSEP